jgi:hypothetical protein
MAVLLRHVNERPLQLIAVDPSADPRLSDWIGRLLATDAAERTPSAATAWLAFEEIVLDLLGSRWRHSAPLDARTPPPMRVAAAPATPPTLALADDAVADQPVAATARQRPADVDERFVATQRPRVVAGGAERPSKGAAAAAAAWRPRDGRVARRLARAVVLLMALAVTVAAGLSLVPGGGSTNPNGAAGSPAGHGASPAARTSPAGVGDSRSDDPSDDEPDGGEP